MINKALALVFTASPSSVAMSADMYIEGQYGMHDADVSTKTYSATVGSYTLSGYGADYEYDNADSLGFEIGAQVSPQVRLGFAYASMDLEFKSATITGSLTDGTTTVTSSAPVTRADVTALGLTLDNEVKLYQLKGYYELSDEGSAVKPYLSAGLGMADIENAKDRELMTSIGAGVNFDLTDDIYLGVGFAYSSIAGPTDELEVEYDDVTITTGQIVVGTRF